MNEKDVLELKNAGFPLQECTLKGCYYSGESLDEDGKNYHYPTFSELIGACGRSLCFIERKAGLREGLDKWHAGNDNIFFDGSTPEQAVKNLWIGINGKN